MRRSWYVLSLTLVVLLGCRRGGSARLPDVDQPLQLLTGETLSGEPVDLARLAGKVVVVSFWSPD